MAAPPAALLGPEDNEEFQGIVRGLTHLKRKLSLNIGRPGTPREEMYAAKVLYGIIGTSPSPAKLALATAQVKVTREELLLEVRDLDKAAFNRGIPGGVC